ncbi:phosphoethanolamine transferase CptA [Halarcobacter sp.]|uniref:phosphoethanolamine transferase CptA n=1 Tax=Halarcobacter sp. TaxID=2321133 RepID=UPI003B004B6C
MTNFFNTLKYFFFFFYFSAIYNLLCIIFDVTGSIGLRESVYATFLWLIPILLFQKHAKKIAAYIGIFLWLGSLFSLNYFFLYGQEFSQSVIFIIFESNLVESTEFLKTYFQWWIIPFIFVYSFLSYYFWKKLPEIKTSSKAIYLFIVFSLLIPFHKFLELYYVEKKPYEIAVYKQMTRMQASTPWNIVLGYVNYKNDLNQMEKLLERNSTLKPIENLKDNYKDEASTLILVLGESTNRNRMGIYGYKRDTTPNLYKLKDDLILFDNVYSPRPYTIEVLQQALSFADEKNPNLYLNKPNLINIMKQAGYSTYWITNQQTQTKRNTMLTTFSKMCDNQIYLNNNQKQNSNSYDEVVLEPFKNVLADTKIKKKFIVVHLLGTHNKYEYRYPKDFAIFDNFKVDDDRLNDKEKRYYNDYDNAVFYNDYVVSKIIEDAKSNKDSTALLYLSDHGEEVFDNKSVKKLGRNEDAPTLSMYAIPFIIYQNRVFKEKIKDFKSLKKYTSREYSSSDLIYTFTDLAGLNFKEFDPSRSVINEEFLEKPVLIGNPSNKNKLRDIKDIRNL